MKESIKYPDFNNKAKTLTYKKSFDEKQINQYENYARWVGGFIEDLYYNKYDKDALYYNPWIKTVLDTHKTWFIDHIDYYEHTTKLQNRIKLLDQPSTACCPNI